MVESTPAPARLSHALTLIGIVLVVLGATVIAGWLLKVPAIVRLAPGYASMAFNTALGFVALGAALAIPESHARRTRAQVLLGAAVAALAALVLTQDIFSIEGWTTCSAPTGSTSPARTRRAWRRPPPSPSCSPVWRWS